MRLFFDTEFTGLHKNTTLISIGLISETGRTFYAELLDYDKSQVDEWIQSNVIDKLRFSGIEGFKSSNVKYYGAEGYETIESYDFEMCDRKEMVSIELRRWLKQFDKVEWVSDVCHYDFVLLIDLLYGYALQMPYGVYCSACHDINQDIANYFNCDEIEAFDMNREDICSKVGFPCEDNNKHNALHDAMVINIIHNVICK